MDFIKGHVSESNALEVMLEAGAPIALPKGKFNVQKGQLVTIGIRPTQLDVTAEGISINVTGVEQLGGESHIFGTTSDGAPFTIHTGGQTSVVLGDTIRVSVQTTEMHLFDSDTGQSLLQPEGVTVAKVAAL